MSIRLLTLLFGFLLICSGCSFFLGEGRHADIRTEVSDGEVVFLLPHLPVLQTLYVEEFDETDAGYDRWRSAWSISFIASESKQHPIDNIIYGKAPIDAAIEGMSDACQLKNGVLYSVSMDVGSVAASGYFIIEKSAEEIMVKNLKPGEAAEYLHSRIP